MGHAHEETHVTKDQSGNAPETKPGAPPPVVGSDPGGLLDHQSGIPQFVPEPYGETAAGTIVSGTVVAEIVDNPSDMAHEYAIVRIDLGSDRYVRLGGPYIVEKKR